LKETRFSSAFNDDDDALFHGDGESAGEHGREEGDEALPLDEIAASQQRKRFTQQ